VLIGNQNIGSAGPRWRTVHARLRASIRKRSGRSRRNYFFLSSVAVTQGVSSDGRPDPPGCISRTSTRDRGGIRHVHRGSWIFCRDAVVTLQSFVQGPTANVLFNLSNSGGWRWDGIAGFAT